MGKEATVVEIMECYTVLKTPSKHRYCIIEPIREDFEEKANPGE